MRNIIFFGLAVLFLLFSLYAICFAQGNSGIKWNRQYNLPVPSKKSYQVVVKVECYPEKEFRILAKKHFPKSKGVVGYTLIYSDGTYLVAIPVDEEQGIDLDTLGHEIFYHVMENDHH